MQGIAVKHHPPVLHGEIVELEPELGHGWVQFGNARKLYFQRGDLASDTCAHPDKATRLWFCGMQVEKGAHAASVTIAD